MMKKPGRYERLRLISGTRKYPTGKTPANRLLSPTRQLLQSRRDKPVLAELQYMEQMEAELKMQ
jgi:hypothetical protein